MITNDDWRKLRCESIDRAIESWAYRLVAFVLVPEHLHLLVLPTTKVVTVDKFLSAVKQPQSVRIKQILQQNNSPLLKRLTIQKRPGTTSFRYWQEGPGYDRNLSMERAVMSAINYIHENPVRRGLCRAAIDWKWSSARWYASDAQIIDPDLPTIHGLPWNFLTSQWNEAPIGSCSRPMVAHPTSNVLRGRIGTGDPKPSPVAPKNGPLTLIGFWGSPVLSLPPRRRNQTRNGERTYQHLSAIRRSHRRCEIGAEMSHHLQLVKLTALFRIT